MKHTIIFSKDTASEYFYDKEDSNMSWIYNKEFVCQTMHTNSLILKYKGWLYLREVYNRLGLDATKIPARLGWELSRKSRFKYKIIEHEDEEKFEIIVDPEELE